MFIIVVVVVVLSAVQFISFVFTLNIIKKYTQGHNNSVDSVSFRWWLDAFRPYSDNRRADP